jgi:hypothetical protein
MKSPRRFIPMSARFFVPLLCSMISCTIRISALLMSDSSNIFFTKLNYIQESWQVNHFREMLDAIRVTLYALRIFLERTSEDQGIKQQGIRIPEDQVTK